MNRDAWIGLAALCVLAAFVTVLVMLAGTDDEVPASSPAARSDALPTLEVAPLDEAPIATVEIETAPQADGQPGGAVSTSEMIARYERESVDAGWAEAAEDRLRAYLGGVLEGGSEVLELECRETLCRTRIEFTDPSRRTRGMASLMEALQAPGGPVRQVAIERLGTIRATLLLAPAG